MTQPYETQEELEEGWSFPHIDPDDPTILETLNELRDCFDTNTRLHYVNKDEHVDYGQQEHPEDFNL